MSVYAINTARRITRKQSVGYTRPVNKKKELQAVRRKLLALILAERFDGNKAALARAIEREPTVVWGMLVTGKNNKPIGEVMARHIERALNLSEYYLDGRAQSLQNSGSIPSDVADALVESRPVPLYTFESLGRDGLLASDLIQRVGIVFGNKNLSAEVRGLIVDTDAMTPEFAVGDRIIVDPAITPRAGDSVVALVDHALLFRRYRPSGDGDGHSGAFELYASNTNYASISSRQTEIQVQAVMVEHHRYRRQ